MTKYFAVVDNSNLQKRSKFADDYVFYGTAKQAVKELDRLSSAHGSSKDVTVYKVTKKPEVVDYADTTLAAQYGKFKGAARAKVEGFIERHDIPTTKTAAKDKLEGLKAVAIKEGIDAGTQIGTTLLSAWQFGQKDPKVLAESAKKGAIAKAKGVQARLIDYFVDVKGDAEATGRDIEKGTLVAAAEAVNSVVGANPDAMKLEDGRRVVRAAYLLVDSNATQVSVADLKKAATPAPRKNLATPK
jgi:hypothetical protein